MQKGYLRGVIAGAIMGAFAGMLIKPQRKMELSDIKNLAEDAQLPQKARTFLKGVSRKARKSMK